MTAQSPAHLLGALVVGLLACTFSAGCDHAPPFAAPTATDLGPRGAGNPVQVTYSPGADLRPSWLPDGSGFFYSRERTDRDDHDRCLALMPAAGGTVREEICDRAPTSDDSIATFESAAVTADGRLAYLRAGTPVVPVTVAPRTLELRLGTRTAPAGTMVRAFPYTAPSGRIHQSLSGLQWRSDAQLVYLAEEVHYEAACSGCAPDTIRIGVEVVTVDPGTGALVTVPGTDSATSVAVTGTDTVYYTRAGSSTVSRRVLSTGAVTTVQNFGAAVRDVTVSGDRLAAITGPGSLWLVRPGAGVTPLTAPGFVLFRRPALSPDGNRLVVEGYAARFDTVRVNGVIVAINTIVSRVSDLWLFEVP